MDITKNEFAERLAHKRGIPVTEAKKIIADFGEVLTETLCEYDRVVFRGFLTFRKKTRKSRTVNVIGQTFTSPEKTTVSIHVGKNLSDKLNTKV